MLVLSSIRGPFAETLQSFVAFLVGLLEKVWWLMLKERSELVNQTRGNAAGVFVCECTELKNHCDRN